MKHIMALIHKLDSKCPRNVIRRDSKRGYRVPGPRLVVGIDNEGDWVASIILKTKRKFSVTRDDPIEAIRELDDLCSHMGVEKKYYVTR